MKRNGISQFENDFTEQGRYAAITVSDAKKVFAHLGIVITVTLMSMSSLHMFSEGVSYAMNKTMVNEAQAKEIILSPIPTPELNVIPSPSPEEEYIDDRAEKLGSWLKSKGSALAPHANYIIQVSDENGIDWTLIVAIANKESTLCKQIKPGSHNCWGLGGANGFMYFDSYPAAIKYEAELLNRAYRENANRGIQAKYCPDHECASNWVSTVSNTSREILKQE